jgi:PAS domain S-box-containing protein
VNFSSLRLVRCMADLSGAGLGALARSQATPSYPSTPGDSIYRAVLDTLPAAVYVTDRIGRITYFNDAAAALWGHRPEIGDAKWCGSWRLLWPDGRAMAHEECPMALAVRERRAIRGIEAVAERPDGTRVPFLPFPTPIYDTAGEFLGAVNLLVDISDRKRAEDTTLRIASIVDSSDDAIISKDLRGTIRTWNLGAERLFGYTAEEMIGRSITVLIPADLHGEEHEILARLARGERIDHYETVRQRKDGSMIPVSISVAPVRDFEGRVVGASKIARDITESKRVAAQRDLLLREMDHRIKNLFQLAIALVSMGSRTAGTPAELSRMMRDRLGALARAQALTIPDFRNARPKAEASSTLDALIRTILAPYIEEGRIDRLRLAGPALPVGQSAVTGLALVLNEFATNAAKYGALACDDGQISVTWSIGDGQLQLIWMERGGPRISAPPAMNARGFGSILARTTVANQFGGTLERDWDAEGLTIRMFLKPQSLAA